MLQMPMKDKWSAPVLMRKNDALCGLYHTYDINGILNVNPHITTDEQLHQMLWGLYQNATLTPRYIIRERDVKLEPDEHTFIV